MGGGGGGREGVKIISETYLNSATDGFPGCVEQLLTAPHRGGSFISVEQRHELRGLASGLLVKSG